MILRDISGRKQAEEDLRHTQKMEAVGQLTGGVAHDFNNLLAAVLGHAQLLEDRLGADNPSLQVLIRTVERGAELTQRLLAFSRRQTLKPTSIDVDALIDEVSGLLRRTLPESIDIRTTSEATLWPCQADRAQMENALVNLALNARDAMAGGGALTIAATNFAIDDEYAATLDDVSPGDYVKLSVSDSGTGMAPEIVERVFEPFFTTKDVGRGSGLGLSMVYGFAKQSGGHVVVNSEEGKGTTVELFPPKAAGAVESVEGPMAVEAPPGRDEVILVIEDEEAVREIIARSLRILGYNAIEAKDGEQAMAALARNPRVDLLLTDVVLPGGMNGPDIVEQARRHSPDIKALFISGYPLRAMSHQTGLPDDAEFLDKPFGRHELAIKVRSVLDSHAT